VKAEPRKKEAPPSKSQAVPDKPSRTRASGLQIPHDANAVTLTVDGGPVQLTNLQKVFFPGLGLTKRDLLQYYLDVSPWLLPHLHNRAMVMKRYPNGINGEFFFMKRAPPRARPPFRCVLSSMAPATLLTSR
jgi:bifunctional non-homologous end joining protein LigD